MKVKKIIPLALIFLLTTTMVFGQSKRKKRKEANIKWNYEIKCEGISNNGDFLLKVFSFADNRSLDMETAKKNAVHGVIFKGIISTDRSCVTQPALVKDINKQQKEKAYFDKFFSPGGAYTKFVNLTTGGAIGANDRFIVKIGRKRYHKIGVMLSVNKNLLRKELEEAGIINKLTSGF
tara:strand:+ start:10027 stop:10560 length:534 start_codon:yes stop_codon:yes gene_type:complete